MSATLGSMLFERHEPRVAKALWIALFVSVAVIGPTLQAAHAESLTAERGDAAGAPPVGFGYFEKYVSAGTGSSQADIDAFQAATAGGVNVAALNEAAVTALCAPYLPLGMTPGDLTSGARFQFSRYAVMNVNLDRNGDGVLETKAWFDCAAHGIDGQPRAVAVSAFEVKNLAGQVLLRVTGLLGRPRVALTVSPAAPDGLGGYYTTPPKISMSNTEAVPMSYSWDSTSSLGAYSAPLNAPEGRHTLYCVAWPRKTDPSYGHMAHGDGDFEELTGAFGVRSADITSATFNVDLTPPGVAANLRAVPGSGRVDLAWTNPAGDFALTRVLRSLTGQAASPAPGGGQTSVYEGTAQGYSDTGVANGIRYYYTAFARDVAGNWSGASSAWAVPGTGSSGGGSRASLARPALRPVAPRRGRLFTVTGTIRPAHTAASTVRLYFWRKVGRRWVRQSVYARARVGASTVRYSVRHRLRAAGRWYVKAYHACPAHAASWSALRAFAVR